MRRTSTRASGRQAKREMAAEFDLVDLGRLCGTGKPLAKEAPIPWMEGIDLARGLPCWVPAEAVHLDTTLPTKPGSGHFLVGSNGLASGNHLLEAVGAAICEVVERDAVAIWDARPTEDRGLARLDLAVRRRPRLPLTSGRLREGWYGGAGLERDLGHRHRVVRLRYFPEVEDPSVDLPRFRGAGCHPNRGIALARALTEAAQMRLTHITGIRDDLPSSEYRKSPRERLGAALLDYISSEAEPCSFAEVPSFETDDLAAEVQWELEQLARAGGGPGRRGRSHAA